MFVNDLAGKACLITGASQGIGASVAKLLGQAGVNVAVHYNSNEEGAIGVADEVRSYGQKAMIIKANLTENETSKNLVSSVVEEFGKVDIVINNAGSFFERTVVEQCSDELLTRLINLNIISTVNICQQVIPHFREQGSGNIINTTSSGARTGGGKGMTLYASCKAFVNTFSRGLAVEVAEHKVRVNVVSPGITETRLQGADFVSQEYLSSLVTSLPLGRIGQPEEIAGAYLYFASDRLSSYVTGQVLEVNGGLTMP